MRTIEKEPWPEFVGLSLEGQRAINNALLGYAQLLYVQLADMGLAQRARVARLGTIQDTHYGSRAECEALMAEIAAAVATIKAKRDIGEELKGRADLIRAAVTYRHPADSIPQDRSLPSAYAFVGAAVPVREANVLAEDYWDLHQLLLG
jgi:ABC-type sulfate transport system substrate-binding protein